MKILTLALILFLFCGCAAKKLIVKNADSLLQYQIEKYIPLNSTQKKILSMDVDRFFNENKSRVQELLPLIDSITLEATGNIQGQFDEMTKFVKLISMDLSKVLTKQLATLSVEQQKDFFKRIDKEKTHLAKKNKKKQSHEFEKRFEVFFGKMNISQKNLYADYQSYFNQRFKERMKRREILHQEIRTIYVQTQDNEKTRQDKINDILTNYIQRPYENEKSIEIINKLIPTLGKEQRIHFKKMVQDLKELLGYFVENKY